MRKALIISPTFNEEGNIDKLIRQIFEQQTKTSIWELHVLIVDSNSTDKTAQKVKLLQKKYHFLHLLETPKEGLGKAYMQGFAYGLEKINAYVIFEIDADLSHDPNDIPRFLKKIEEGADFVVGSRYMKGGSIPDNWGLHRKFLSIFANLIVKLGFMKLKVTEWTNGYRAIKAWIIKDSFDYLKNYSGYVFQIAFLDYALKHNAKEVEIPIHFKDRISGISKINAFQYIFNTLLYVLLNSDFIKFVVVGFIGFAVDFSFAYSFINFFHISKAIANMLSAEIAIIFNFLLNNFWSFRHKKIIGGTFAYIKKFITFNLVSSGSILIQGIGIFLALKFIGDKVIHVTSFGISSWIIYKVLLIACVIIPYSYILYNKFIWKEK
ncbi:MAG: glycosyltransferase [bacterium]|nr:glycosyltransferase [bacterium]